MTGGTAIAKSARRPTTLRLYDALGVHPALGGVYLAIAWTVLLVGGEWASGRLAPEAIDAPDGIELFELAVALFLGLFLVFVTAAYAAYSRRTALTVDANLQMHLGSSICIWLCVM